VLFVYFVLFVLFVYFVLFVVGFWINERSPQGRRFARLKPSHYELAFV